MEPKDLIKIWDVPDQSKLSPKQISIRLPILTSARISALCEMYPGKTKNQIIVDLITSALDQLIEGLPSEKGKYLGLDESTFYDDPELDSYRRVDGDAGVTPSKIYEDVGLKGSFLRITKKHLKVLEKEAGSKDPLPCPDPVLYVDEE